MVKFVDILNLSSRKHMLTRNDVYAT